MKKYLLPIAFFLIFTSISIYAQEASIKYESNGKTTTLGSSNPFAKFFGEWTLKDDDWRQNWGGETEYIKIPKHHTVSAGINTKNTLISIIDGPEPNGHIFWSYNPNTKEVYHLSSFGDIRAGYGKGTIDENGNLSLKLSFEGESKGTYRIYSYTWLNDDEYELKSIQYDKNDKPTGLFYGGNFIRIETSKTEKIKEEIKGILKTLDDNTITIDEKMYLYADDLVHMAPDNKAITSKDELSSYLKEQAKYGNSKMKHEIIDYEILDDIVIMQGSVIGTFHPIDGKKPVEFRTKNFFIFKRIDNELKIWKIIFNMSSTE